MRTISDLRLIKIWLSDRPGHPGGTPPVVVSDRGSTSGSNLSESPGGVEHPKGSTEPHGT